MHASNLSPPFFFVYLMTHTHFSFAPFLKVKGRMAPHAQQAQHQQQTTSEANGSEAGRKFFVNIYCADGSTKEAILVDNHMTVSQVIRLMCERSHVECHARWGLVEHIPELGVER